MPTLEEVLLERRNNPKRPLTMEDILNMRQETPSESLPSLGERRGTFDADLEYLSSLPDIIPQERGTFPLSNLRDIASSVGSAYTGALETLSGGKYGETMGPINPISSEIDARRRGIVGAGEAALSLGSGLVGGMVGLGGAGEQLTRDIGSSIFREGGYSPAPEDPKYWTKLVDSARKLSSEFTYEPRTPEGRAIMEKGVAPVMEIMGEFSRRFAEGVAVTGLINDDQKKAVAYAHELVMMMALGTLGTSAMRSIGRERVANFKKTFIDAAKEGESGGPKTEALGKLAEEIRDKAERTPEIAERFSPERVEALRERQRSQGFSDLERGLSEMEKVRLSERDQSLVPRLRNEGKIVLDHLNENLENPDYVSHAREFLRKTEGFGNEEISALRLKIGENIGFEETYPSPRAKGPGDPYTPPYARGITREGDVEGNRLQARMDMLKEDMKVGEEVRQQIQEGLEHFSSPTPAIKPSKESQNKPNYTTFGNRNLKSATEDIPPVKDGEIRLYRTDIPPEQRQNMAPNNPFNQSHVASHDYDWIKGWRDSHAPGVDIYYIDVPFDPANPLEPSPRASITPQERTQLKLFEKAPKVEEGFDAPAPEWLKANMQVYVETADRLGITSKIIELAHKKMVADDIVDAIPELQNIPLQERVNVVRSVRDRAGIEPAGPIGYTGGLTRKSLPDPTSIMNDLMKSHQNGEISTAAARDRVRSVQAWERNETGPPEWVIESLKPEAISTEATLRETSKSSGRGTPSTQSAEAKLQAIEESNSFATRESTIKAIQDSLESGKDISDEIRNAISGEVRATIAVQNYKNMMEIQRKGIESSKPRNLIDMIHDIVELFAFDVDPNKLGLFGNVSLSHRQRMAAQRLTADAAKAGKTLEQYMTDQGMSEPYKVVIRDYLDSIPRIAPPNAVGPKNMSIDGKGMTTDPIIERQIHIVEGKEYLGPPQYFEAMKALQNANEIEFPRWKELYSMETAGRTLKKAGQPIFDMVYPRANESRRAAKLEITEMRNDLQKLEKIVNNKDRFAMTNDAPASLTPKQLEIMDLIESGGEEILRRIDEVRKAIGNNPLPNIDSSVGLIRAINRARSVDKSINLTKASGAEIQQFLDTFGEGPMGKTWTQKALGMSGEKDIFRQFDSFATQAYEQIHISPLTAAIKENINYKRLDVIAMDGSKFHLAEANPGLHKFMNDLMDTFDGKSPVPTPIDKVFRAFNENLSWALLSANLRSVVAQPSSLVNTWYKVGSKDFFGALNDSLQSVLGKGNMRRLALEESDTLSIRNEADLYGGITARTGEGLFKDIARGAKEAKAAISEGRMRDFTRDIAQIGMHGLEWADYEAAVITYNAFRRQGERLGLKGEALKRFADDGVVTTQASGWRGDLSPIQRTALGKTLLQFQTFSINDANFMWNEVLKPPKGQPYTETLKNVGRFVGIVTAFNSMMDIFEIDPPTPNVLTPSVRRLVKGETPFVGTIPRGIEKGEDPLTIAMKTGVEMVAPYIPILGPVFKYGKLGGPSLGLLTDAANTMLGRPGSKSLLEPISEGIGVPFSAQFWRTRRGDPDATVIQRILNYKPEEQGSSGNLSSGLSGGLKGGLKSGLK